MITKSRKFAFRAACSIMALAACGMTATPVMAQLSDIPRNALEVLGRFQETGQVIDARLRRAEENRLAGNCAGRARALDSAELGIGVLETLARHIGGGLIDPAARIADARSRKQEIADAPCPPVKDVAPPPPLTELTPPSPVTREPGQTRTLDDLRIEYAVACGDEEGPARARLLTAYDRLIRQETDPEKREKLKRQRDHIAKQGEKKTCAAPPTTEAPAAELALSPVEIKMQSEMFEDIEALFSSAEAARLRGDCGQWGTDLQQIKISLGSIRFSTLFSKAGKAEWEARRADAAKRPCPPDKRTGARPMTDAEVLASATPAQKAAIFLTVLYSPWLLPRIGIGVRRDGAPGAAPEVDAGRTARRVNSLGISAGFQTKVAADFDLRVIGTYGKGDATTNISVPATSAAQRVDTGVVYGRLSNGSSGIIAGGGGMGATRIDLTNWGVKADIGRDFGAVRVAVGASYDRLEREHDLAIASSLVSGGFTFNFAQSRLQQLDENFYGLYGSADATIPICPDADFKLSVVGGPYWRDTDFEGIERDTANFGPMGNRDLTLSFAEKEGSWGAHGRAAAGIEYRLGGGLSLTAGASVEYRSEVGKVVNPNSGDQVFFQGQTTRLERDDASAWNAFLGARFSF